MTPRPTVIEIVVADMAASLAFYRRLGLDAPPAADGEAHVEMELGGGLRLALDTEEVARAIDPSWTPPSGGHRMAIACACDSPGDVDAAHAELTGAGYASAHAPWDAFWGMRYAVVLDPDGVPVDLFAPLTAGDTQRGGAGALPQ